MPTLTTIPARFNGPPASGNGGYSCGLLAAHIRGPARVRLHVPPPLETGLRITASDSGGVAMYDGDTLVGSAAPATLDLEIPAPPSLAEAQAAMERFPCYTNHIFPTCFVCGPERPHRDGLALFPGPVGDTALWACVWRPTPDLLDESGHIRPEIMWSALDCPGYFAALGSVLRPALLGELAGEIRAAPRGDLPLVVYAWPLGEDGRKFFAGAAIAAPDGQVVACARSTWIVLRT
jgi:hypothetical protein